MKCFIDCDDVLMAFGDHVFDHFGQYPNDMPVDDMWALIAEVADFWSTMPVKHGAHRLWRAVHALNPAVLTGCPASDYDRAASQKVPLLRRHFGASTEVITCLGRNKLRYMTSPDDILVDDFHSRVRRWCKAGGRGVYYRNAEQAISDLNAMVLKPGDLVQVSIGDVDMFEQPVPIEAICHHQGTPYVLVAGSGTGVAMHDVILERKAT